MRSSLPWDSCPTLENTANGTQVPECSKSSPAKYYWYRETLDVGDDINKSTGKILIETISFPYGSDFVQLNLLTR